MSLGDAAMSGGDCGVVDLDRLSSRPMTHATALIAITQAGCLLTSQAAQLESSDPLSVSATDETKAGETIGKLRDILSTEVAPAPDPLPDSVADHVETAVRNALGLRSGIAAAADDAAMSVWHAIGLPQAAPKPNIPSPLPPWLPSISTLILFGALAYGASVVYKNFRRAA